MNYQKLSILRCGLLLFALANTTFGQHFINDQLNEFTTLIQVVSPIGMSQASGFFYNELGPGDHQKTTPQWRQITRTWLVTNRHVVLARLSVNNNGHFTDVEFTPSKLTFNLRKNVGGQLKWDPIDLSQADLVKRTKCPLNSAIDVCIIEIGDLLTKRIKDGGTTGTSPYMNFGGVSKDDLPGPSNKLSVDAGDSVIVAGYPKGFYDDFNLFPVLKSGLIGSRWGANFKGLPCFLIDGQMFPGSSGSIVISKPTDVVAENGQIFLSKEKQFVFLGILSGEWWDNSTNQEIPISTSLSLVLKGAVNTAIIWYGNLIEDIIATSAAPTLQAPTTLH